VPGTAAEPARGQDAASPQTALEKPKEKKLCRREMAIGSNFPVRVCKTRNEWAAEGARNRDSFESRERDPAQDKDDIQSQNPS
jgi:hypothetical protein